LGPPNGDRRDPVHRDGGPAGRQSQIQAAISDVVTSAILKQVDTKAVVGEVLGGLFKDSPMAESLAAPLSAGINGLISELVRKFVASDAFRDIWIETNKVAQASLISLLEGKDTGPIQLNGNQVVLDISGLLNTVKQQVVALGPHPGRERRDPQDGHPDRALRVADPGPDPVARTSSNSPVLAWFPLIIAALFCLAIALARNRPRTTLATGLALIVLAGVSLWLMDYAEAMLVHDITGTVLEGALTSFWSTFFAYLLKGLWAMVLLGVFVGLGGWYAGRSRPATAVREAVCRGLHALGPAGGGPNSWVPVPAPFLRWSTVVVLTLVLHPGQRDGRLAGLLDLRTRGGHLHGHRDAQWPRSRRLRRGERGRIERGGIDDRLAGGHERPAHQASSACVA
jgi:hypothetical protein